MEKVGTPCAGFDHDRPCFVCFESDVLQCVDVIGNLPCTEQATGSTSVLNSSLRPLRTLPSASRDPLLIPPRDAILSWTLPIVLRIFERYVPRRSPGTPRTQRAGAMRYDHLLAAAAGVVPIQRHLLCPDGAVREGGPSDDRACSRRDHPRLHGLQVGYPFHCAFYRPSCFFSRCGFASMRCIR